MATRNQRKGEKAQALSSIVFLPVLAVYTCKQQYLFIDEAILPLDERSK